MNKKIEAALKEFRAMLKIPWDPLDSPWKEDFYEGTYRELSQIEQRLFLRMLSGKEKLAFIENQLHDNLPNKKECTEIDTACLNTSCTPVKTKDIISCLIMSDLPAREVARLISGNVIRSVDSANYSKKNFFQSLPLVYDPFRCIPILYCIYQMRKIDYVTGYNMARPDNWMFYQLAIERAEDESEQLMVMTETLKVEIQREDPMAEKFQLREFAYEMMQIISGSNLELARKFAEELLNELLAGTFSAGSASLYQEDNVAFMRFVLGVITQANFNYLREKLLAVGHIPEEVQTAILQWFSNSGGSYVAKPDR